MRKTLSYIASRNEVKGTKLLDAIKPWSYRLATFLTMGLLDDPAMLALAFC